MAVEKEETKQEVQGETERITSSIFAKWIAALELFHILGNDIHGRQWILLRRSELYIWSDKNLEKCGIYHFSAPLSQYFIEASWLQ